MKKEKKNTNFDRELKGPDSYEYFNNISKYCQNQYVEILRAQLVLLGLIAAISIIPPSECSGKILQSINIIIMVIVLILMVIQNGKKYMAGWQKARFLAESILSNCWLLVFKYDHYSEGDYESALGVFYERMKEMKKEINVNDYLSYSKQINEDNDDPQWMRENYKKPIGEKRDFYIEHRINDQIDWYGKKTGINNKNSSAYFYYGLASLIIGIILSVLVLIELVPDLAYLGLFTTVTASIFSWKQTKRFDELKTTYSVAALELKDFKKVLMRKTHEADIKEVVFDTEKSISREHKLWFSKVLD